MRSFLLVRVLRTDGSAFTDPMHAATEMRCAWWTKKLRVLVRDVPYLVESRAPLPVARRARCETYDREFGAIVEV